MFEQNRKLYRENEETILSLMSQIKSMFDELKSEHEKDSQFLVELLQQSFRVSEEKYNIFILLNKVYLGDAIFAEREFTRCIDDLQRESSFRNANVKFHELNEKLCEDKASHQQARLQALDDIFSKFEEAKERFIMQYDQISKKEKSMISALADKVAKLDKSLKIEEEIEEEFKTLMRTLCLYM
ncbi:uncharacterized protein LOC104422609 isoform X2 [Eucalyptus grandis]|nr:uncharacterized protein LOC104422609 isoform X2 [Eucalyptus grandis]